MTMGLEFHGSFGYPGGRKRKAGDSIAPPEWPSSMGPLSGVLLSNKRRKLDSYDGISFSFTGGLQSPQTSIGAFTFRSPPDSPKVITDLLMDDPAFLAQKTHVENVLQYLFKRPELLREAMYCFKGVPARLPSGQVLIEANYQLAQVGDSILRMTLIDYWFEHERKSIGTTEACLQRLIPDRNLTIVAQMHGISALLHKYGGAGTGKKGIPTTVEAIIGAVWYDSGKDVLTMRNILSILLGVTFEESRKQQ